ncbi:hypothetical protein FSP39_017379 [Pinctada imbricata]|uniref:Zinc finger PHD-type domain-containing protein n=1 Tax=Pinctada imbricata TaxID=66713 RepID=A0AA88XV53_PINIB|nr:hypothetical protein FSP39_017379 [Pinctada imbricata]
MKKVKEGEGSSKNFYAITNGRCTGIYKAWSQVKPLVDKYPGAAFKGFVSLDEAVEFMQKGGFAETDIPIYEIEDEILTRSGESENIPAVEERSVFEDCTEETNVKLCDAQEFSSENTQGACNDSENHKKAHCVMCKSGESKEMLQCSACNGRVHLLCSGLPKYQIMVFRNTQRKFMCQSCVENSSEIKMKNARKSYTELRDDDHQSTTERQDGSNHTNQHQPCAENFGEIKREIGNINLTLSNFEQEILKVITQMRNENLSLREKECIERVKSAESLRDSIVEQKEKAENCNKELTTQIGNLKDKITKLQTETDNLRKHAAKSAEIQKRLEEEVKQKDAEISELQGRNQALECEKKVPSFNFHEQQPNSQSQQLNVNEISVCSYETSNRFECLDSEVRQEPLSGDNCIYIKGHRDPLSNFYRMRFVWDNHTYNSVEIAFQHEKAMRQPLL